MLNIGPFLVRKWRFQKEWNFAILSVEYLFFSKNFLFSRIYVHTFYSEENYLIAKLVYFFLIMLQAQWKILSGHGVNLTWFKCLSDQEVTTYLWSLTTCLMREWKAPAENRSDGRIWEKASLLNVRFYWIYYQKVPYWTFLSTRRRWLL